MVIIETSIFTKKINALLSDANYRELQNHLIESPGAGALIQNSGGIRKIRWGGEGRGKRGGARIIYYWADKLHQIFMLYVFAKNERDDLTKNQLKQLRKAVESEFKR